MVLTWRSAIEHQQIGPENSGLYLELILVLFVMYLSNVLRNK